MPPVPEAEFERGFRSLPAAERTAFVADLWSARGWATSVEDGVVVAERDDEHKRIRVVDPGRFGTPRIGTADTLVVARDRDAVRTAAMEADVEYVPPTDLRDVLLYGIDRDVARELYRDRFDDPLERSPTDDEPTDSERNSRVVALSAIGPSLSGNRRGVIALLLIALVGVAVAGPMLSGGGGPSQTPITVNNVTPEDERAGAIGAASPSPTEAPGLLPGVTQAGVVNPRTLAAAHVDGVRNRSRILERELVKSPNSTSIGATVGTNLTARIVNASHYRSAHVRTVNGENGSYEMGVGLYAAGGDLYQRTALRDGVRYSRFAIEEYPATELDREIEVYLYRYFAGAENTVVRCAIEFDSDCPTYRIEITGDPPATLGEEVADYRALAIVSENGVITTIRASYTLPDSDDDGEREPVRFALDYRFENVTVTAPEWLPAAQNATAGNGTATPSPTPLSTDETN